MTVTQEQHTDARLAGIMCLANYCVRAATLSPCN